MPEQTTSSAAENLHPDAIIQAVKLRFRICNYLFNVGGVWLLLGVVLSLIGTRLPLSNGTENSPLLSIAIVMEILGIAIFTLAFALTLAIYHCPVCDTYLSRFRKDKLRCPNCKAQVKLSK